MEKKQIKKKLKPGRKPVFTDKKIIDALKKAGGFYSKAASLLGCSRQTILDARKRSPELERTLKDIRESYVDMAEISLINLVREGELGAICFFLKTQGRSRGYVERQELTGKDGESLVTPNHTYNYDLYKNQKQISQSKNKVEPS